MKKLSTLLIAFALIAICVFLLPTEAQAVVVDSGTCGDNLTWTLDDEGTLTISGSGPMKNYSYSYYSHSPWHGNTAVKKVVIEDGVTTIGNYAFDGCTSLTSVTIPDSVTTIGESAFSDCTSLTSVTIPDSVTTIGDSAFHGCDELRHVTIPDSVTTIGNSAFKYCVDLVSVTIGNGVTTIGNSAFNRCDILTSVTIGDSVTTIGEYAFESCGNLTSIVIPKGIDTIKTNAFSYCPVLTKVYHKGSQADWDWIIIEDGNDYLKNAIIIHYYTGCDHTWGVGAVTKQPTCCEYGQKTYTCSSCGSTRTENLPKTNVHSYNGVVTKEPTCGAVGTKTFACSVCGDSYTEEIAKTSEHSYADGVCTVCGGEDPTYVPPTEPTEPPTEPSEPTDPTEPTEPGVDVPAEPDNDKEEGGFFAAIAAFFEAIFRILFFFLYL